MREQGSTRLGDLPKVTECRGPAPVGSSDSLRMMVLAKRIEIEKEIRKEFCS